jgi:glycosyltransferase involved in cell wall biosynthesis
MRVGLTVDPEIAVPPTAYGGIERIVDMLARGLSERGHDVTLFANAESTCPVALVPWRGRRSSAAWSTLQNAATLAREVAARRLDVVHSFSRLAYLTPILPLSLPKLMSYQRDISARTTRLASRLAGDSLEYTTISRWMVEARGLPGRWSLIPNGVPLDAYQPTPSVGPDAPLVMLGRMEKIKGPHLAIEVARRAGLRLVLAGNVPPEHRHWFDAEVGPHVDDDKVRYLGPVNDAEKNRLLGAARALLMPILWEEPFGIVMVEAMACGAPVIGFRRGAVPEVVEDGVTGFVVDDLDGMVAATAKVEFLSRRSCRERVEALYSDGAITEAYISIYERMSAANTHRAARGVAP